MIRTRGLEGGFFRASMKGVSDPYEGVYASGARAKGLTEH